jgi:hypothetical protein
MKNILRYIALAVLLICAGESLAWNKLGQNAVAALAERHLTEKAKSEVQNILGGNLVSGTLYLNELRKDEATKSAWSWAFVSVNDKLSSTTSSSKDGIVRLEKCIEVLQDRGEYTAEEVKVALRTTISIVTLMHNVSHVRIADEPLSKKNFALCISDGKPKETIHKSTWRKLWESSYIGRHSCYSPAMYAEDLEVHCADKFEQWSKGSVREWLAEFAATECKPLYKWAEDGYYMTREHHNRYEAVNDRSMARAGIRLATLLNQVLQ